MRNRPLHDALRDFALEAAADLTAAVEAGADLAFDVEAMSGRHAVLYNYRPLTDRFIAERWSRLRGLPAFQPAVAALGSGAAAYLRHRGVPGADAEPALRAMLERIYEDAAGFEFPEERFERVYADVEKALYEHSSQVSFVAPMRGVRLERDRTELGAGIALVRGDWADAPADAVWPKRPAAGESVEPNVLCVFEDEIEAGGPVPVEDALNRLGAVQTGLRLFKTGALAAGPLAYARTGEGAWQAFAAGAGADPRGREWLLTAAEEDELREFLALVARSRHGGAVSWALGRFEMGIERGVAADALSDHLLALRALLGQGRERGVAQRVAALCAGEEGRESVRHRLEVAFELERAIVAGHAPGSVTGGESPGSIVAEVEDHLRALLRDVLCGYLDADLHGLADRALAAAGETACAETESGGPPEGGEIHVRRIRRAGPPGAVPTERDERAPADDGELEPDTEELGPPVETARPGRERRRTVRSQLAWSPPAGAVSTLERPKIPPEAAAKRQPEPEAAEVAEQDLLTGYATSLDFDDAGVTPSADWDAGEPDDFSAPI